MNKFTPTKLIGAESDLLVCIKGYNVLLTSYCPEQFLTPEGARHLANVLCEAAYQIEEKIAFDIKCTTILAALTPAQLKLLEEKLSTVKESDQ